MARVLLWASLLAMAPSVEAYVGPGAGVSLLGALVGLISVLALVFWSFLRWAFRLVFRVGGDGASRGVAPVAASAGVERSAADYRNAAPAAPSSLDFRLRLLYLLAGLLLGSLSTYPRELIESWINVSEHVRQGFHDPILRFIEPARFSAEESGVVMHDKIAAFSGLNLELSATAPEARLLDINGRELHRWQFSYDAFSRAWAAEGEPIMDMSGMHWRRVKPLPDGSLLVLVQNNRKTPYGLGMLKLDWESRVQWMVPAHYHHSVDVGPDGRIYTIYQDVANESVPEISWIKPPLLNEGIAILTPEGQEIDRINIVDAFSGTPFQSFLKRVRQHAKGDPLHMNTVKIVTSEQAGLSSLAEAGQLLVSIRNMNTVAIIDPRIRKVVWAESDLWARQHEPVLTEGANILIFDNRGPADGSSRAVEWDTATGTIVWEWDGDANLPLVSDQWGAVALLPNGNRLISESTGGRAIEVTPGGDIAWEWHTDRVYGNGRQGVGRLMEMIRLPVSFFNGHNFTATGPEDESIR